MRTSIRVTVSINKIRIDAENIDSQIWDPSITNGNNISALFNKQTSSLWTGEPAPLSCFIKEMPAQRPARGLCRRLLFCVLFSVKETDLYRGDFLFCRGCFRGGGGIYDLYHHKITPLIFIGAFQISGDETAICLAVFMLVG